jgi:UDP-glucose 4-epimerase
MPAPTGDFTHGVGAPGRGPRVCYLRHTPRENRPMHVLVTGGAGFIGSHIVDALRAAGHTTAVLDDLSTGSRDHLPADVPLHVADIRNAAAVAAVMERERPDAVCHQAAQVSVSRSVREPRFDAEVNVLGLITMLDAAARRRCPRFVFASSVGLYGDVVTPAPETAAVHPASPYAITKWAGERYLAFHAAEHGLTTIALRYANVYGPRQNPHGEAGVVAIFCRRFLAGEPARIHGDGRSVRDYVYAPDVARANVLALTSLSPALRPGTLTSLNIGTGVGTDVNDLESRLRHAMTAVLARHGRVRPLPSPEHGPPRPGDLRSNRVDPARAAEILGWRPEVALDHGLAHTAAWFHETSVASR